jgi:hypothetical protein
MAGTRSGAADEGTRRRAALKQRAAAARSHATATKAWLANLTTAATGTMWRVTSAWIEESDRTLCADHTHVGSGKVRTIRLLATDDVAEGFRAQILAD